MTETITRDMFYIDGQWVEPAGSDFIEVENPATEEIIGKVPAGTPADVDRAVAAARAAFDGWAETPVEERVKYLTRLQEALAARMDEVARTISAEMGSPLKFAQLVQAGLPLADIATAASGASEIRWTEQIGNSQVVLEPVGVVGAITPWNYPLHQVTAKIGGALAAGCTVVLKPSEVSPLSAYLLFEAIHEIGLPAGVVNLVTGYGPVVGEAIASHPEVDMVSFTGSTRAGTRVAELGAATVKKIALELGGKSANVILPDADLEKAVKVGLANCFINSGQTCTAWTRMLVHESQYDEAVKIAAEGAAGYTTGDPNDDATRLGPLVSGAQRERVVGYIEKGLAEGARLVVGGAERPHEKGHFVSATVFADVTNDMTIAQEEIFGPVLSIIKYSDEEEALRIANDSDYGLAGAVWAGDQDRAIAFAKKMKTGQVDVNGGSFNPVAPFGGYKKSGIGRELGRYGIEEFLQPKSMQL
ncbi:MAG TPA: aldehyde dehydrogenase family protein [Mycobacteriales bacterium]|jgi:aldehyde dehydrogenase (NAD+)|nr:aldehyde dehydrogenase family protein [Mycobacteriales bacterium]